MNPVQQKFVEHFSFQCSYCTPGYVNAATIMVEKLQRQPVKRSELEQEIEAALGQHICRCTGYVRYYQAAKAVVEELGLVREG